jgi:alpha-galactosidase
MGRYQLDYRHLAVTARMDSAIDRLVGLGVGYFEFDYNLDITQATNLPYPDYPISSSCSSCSSLNKSPSSGLLEHIRAHLA